MSATQLITQFANEVYEWDKQRADDKRQDNVAVRDQRVRDIAARLDALGWTEREYRDILLDPVFRVARPLTDRAWPGVLVKLEPLLVRATSLIVG